MTYLLAPTYCLLVGLLACYGLYRYYLVWLYYHVKPHRPIPPAIESWPSVTIQIPVYNERYVVERAIQSACEVDYPADRLEIQILDDSTDDTTDIILRAMAPYHRQGIAVTILHRNDRRDFKAGALADGLEQALGELIAVFDADFIVPRDFLRRTAPYFTQPRTGMVQARWGHVNERYSLLTQSQALLLDGHFGIEQVARHRAGRFFNFNGTAGIWRKEAITASGGWQADTLSEDLDLSYRAQMLGWQCVFLQDLVAHAELPVEMNALKTQQYRWAKGTIQAAKKLLPSILTSKLSWSLKREAFCHLTGFFSYPIGLVASLGLPITLTQPALPQRWYMDLLWFLLLAVPGASFYICTQRELYRDWHKRLAVIPWVVAVGIGLSLNNSRAVFDGLFGNDATFIRTAKLGIGHKDDRWRDHRWRHKGYRTPSTPTAWAELALAAYFLFGCLVALKHHLFLALPSVALLALGFGYVGGLSLWQGSALQHWWLTQAPAPDTQAPPVAELQA